MVNLTDSFTKLYGRRPTEAEIATMWQMKREQENWKKEVVKKKTEAEPVVKKAREPRPPKKIMNTLTSGLREPHSLPSA